MGPALGTAPARGPCGFRHYGTSRRQSPTSAHARCRVGNGEERGQTQHACNPATLPLKSPQQAASRSPGFSQGPMVVSPPRKSHSNSFVRQTRGPALGTAPAARGGSIITEPCSGTTHTCKNIGPPPLPFREGRRRIGRGGETPPPLPFSKALCDVPRPAPGVALAGGRSPSAAIADGRGRVEDWRGYSPSIHFFWEDDMSHYSPPLPFRRGRAGTKFR